MPGRRAARRQYLSSSSNEEKSCALHPFYTGVESWQVRWNLKAKIYNSEFAGRETSSLPSNHGRCRSLCPLLKECSFFRQWHVLTKGMLSESEAIFLKTSKTLVALPTAVAFSTSGWLEKNQSVKKETARGFYLNLWVALFACHGTHVYCSIHPLKHMLKTQSRDSVCIWSGHGDDWCSRPSGYAQRFDDARVARDFWLHPFGAAMAADWASCSCDDSATHGIAGVWFSRWFAMRWIFCWQLPVFSSGQSLWWIGVLFAGVWHPSLLGLRYFLFWDQKLLSSISPFFWKGSNIRFRLLELSFVWKKFCFLKIHI